MLNSCAAVPAVTGYLGGGGVTLYKSEKDSGMKPTLEVVLFKVVISHNVVNYPAPSATPCQRCPVNTAH
jgi:hypothetical protein